MTMTIEERRRESVLRLYSSLPAAVRARPKYSETTMARVLRLSRPEIRRRAEAGILPGHRMPSGHWKFPIDTLLLGLGQPRLRQVRPVEQGAAQ